MALHTGARPRGERRASRIGDAAVRRADPVLRGPMATGVRRGEDGVGAASDVPTAAAGTGDAGEAGWASRLAVLGGWAVRGLREGRASTVFLGELALAAAAAVRGAAKVRREDVRDAFRDSGSAALPIVGAVNFLVGAVLAFVGSVQLARFGAGLYVANLVGVAVAREMAAVMTAIVMAGRTGTAFAARLSAMRRDGEVDALLVLGIAPAEHLVLPRVFALTAAMPLLYVYGCASGLAGGLAVSALLLDVGPAAFAGQLREAVRPAQFAIGAAKSVAFGLLVAFTACRIGLRGSGGAAADDAGAAATSAAVAGIVGVIAVDAAFAVSLNLAGL